MRWKKGDDKDTHEVAEMVKAVYLKLMEFNTTVEESEFVLWSAIGFSLAKQVEDYSIQQWGRIDVVEASKLAHRELQSHGQKCLDSIIETLQKKKENLEQQAKEAEKK